MNSSRTIDIKNWKHFTLAFAFAGLTFPLISQADCGTNELNLRWPMAGTDAVDWVINNYVDLDPTTGIKDYRNNTGVLAKTYDGHNGIDIDLSTGPENIRYNQ